jgi:D-tyrosyl-tRNA(Tyr) deacylase
LRALLQRVSRAQVVVDNQVVGRITKGLLIFLGVGPQDEQRQADWLAEKVAGLRIFEDPDGKMNLSLVDVGGEALVVSQFTLYGDCRKGRRPSFAKAARPEHANALYEHFVSRLKVQASRVETGVFQAHMDVSLVNDGPVTLWLDTADVP